MTLQKVFEGRGSRAELVGLFLATLELVRTRRVRVSQEKPGGEIMLELRPESDHLDPQETEADAGEADRREAETAEGVDYDWPDEASRLRAEKRSRLRARRLDRVELGQANAPQESPDDPPDTGETDGTARG